MSTARERLLCAAREAVASTSWPAVRMVEIAAFAGVSRQTLYNEFGTKEEFGAALVARQVHDFLDGAARAAARARSNGGDPAACCAATAAWMLREARDEPVVRAALTGSWESRSPVPGRPFSPAEPGRLAAALRDRIVGALKSGPQPHAVPAQRLGRACEVGLRMALSYVVAPAGTPDSETCRDIGEVVRTLLSAK